jgi:hypothetical protein
MTRRGWLGTLALVAFVVFVLVRALLPTQWHGQLSTPTGVANEFVTVHCGAPWGSSSVRGPATTAYPVAGNPCGDRRSLQAVSAVDLGLGVAGIALIVGWNRRRATHGVA